MGRLKEELLDRVETFAHRMADVADAIEADGRPRRVVDQMYGCGTSVGANTFEADEALSRADFGKGVGIALKELAEARFWLRFVRRRGWVKANRLVGVEQEAVELRRIFGTILTKTRKNRPKN